MGVYEESAWTPTYFWQVFLGSHLAFYLDGWGKSTVFL
jgi:hypothetical protein